MFLPRPSIDNVSRTALGICAYCALISRHPALRRVYYDPFAEALFGAAAAKGNEILADLPDWAAVEAASQDLGDDVRLLCHVAWRKRWMSDHARAHLAQGIDQVVILGAGLDTLSLRLGSAYPGAVFFEVDQTATVAAKRALVAQLFGPPPHVRYTAVDFAAETAEARLLDTGYDPARPAIFIAEVSLEYVPKEDVAETYRMVRRNGSDRSVFLTTYVLRPDAPESAKNRPDPGVDLWRRRTDAVHAHRGRSACDVRRSGVRRRGLDAGCGGAGLPWPLRRDARRPALRRRAAARFDPDLCRASARVKP